MNDTKRTFEIESSMGTKGTYTFLNQPIDEIGDTPFMLKDKKQVPCVFTIEQFVRFLKDKAYGSSHKVHRGYDIRGYSMGYGYVHSMNPVVKKALTQPTRTGTVGGGNKIIEHMNIKCVETGEQAGYTFIYTTRKPMGKPKGRKRLI